MATMDNEHQLTNTDNYPNESSEGTAVVLLNAFDDMAFLVDRDRNVLIMNEMLLANLGKTAADVVGTSIYDHAPIPWSGDSIDEIDAIEETRAPVRSEVEVYGCTIELRGFPVFDSTGQITQFAVFMRDITGQKQIQQQLLQAEMLRLELQKDRDLLKKQQQFVSMVSHELRNPLTTIRSSLDLLERYDSELSEARKRIHFSRVNAQVDAMKTMLEDLMTLRRTGNDSFKFTPQVSIAGEVCRRIFDEIVQDGKLLHIVTFIDNGPREPVCLDENLLRHILKNLLSNAIKYTPRGGEIRLEVGEAIDDVIIQIADTGIGIPADEQIHLFEPFFRAANASRIDGTGLGLAVARTCVEAHGGTIGFDSVENQGTTFTIYLPRKTT